MPWRQGHSCRPEDHSGHLGPGAELPREANARFPKRRALERDHVTRRQESGRGRSTQDRGLLRGQDVAGAAGVRKAAFATEKRTNNLDMPKFMQMLTERERNAIARYLSAL